MSDRLDEKLRQILDKFTDNSAPDNFYFQKGQNNIIAQIRQAFESEGYIQIPQTEIREVDGVDLIKVNGKPVMTGQEWYERFRAELGDADYQEINADDTGIDYYHLQKHVMTAARRAANRPEDKP